MIASLVGTCRFVQSREKMAESLGYSFKLQQVFYKFFFGLVKSYSISPVCLQRSTKKALLLASFKVSTLTDHLFDNLESGKRNYCFGKKVLNFGSKKSVRTL